MLTVVTRVNTNVNCQRNVQLFCLRPRTDLTYGRCCKDKYVNVQRNVNPFCL